MLGQVISSLLWKFEIYNFSSYWYTDDLLIDREDKLFSYINEHIQNFLKLIASPNPDELMLKEEREKYE